MVRLGYACINTVLRAQDVYTNRTLRLAKVKEQGIQCAKDLGLKNIKDLIPIIQWNEDNGIRFFRVSSCVFPFASEMEYGYSLSYAAKELKEAGDLAKKYGHRLTTHPGQYNVLCSPNPSVVTKTFRDLEYHAEMLDLMGMGPDSVMIIHMGGAYGDKPKSVERFEQNFVKLPENVRNRIVLENDEISYKVEDLLPVCKKLKIPLVLDWHHDRLNPSTKPIAEYLPEIDAIWKERGIKPKQHYSESAKGHPNPRTHSDYVSKLPPCAPDMDLMIEAKMKDQTVLRLCRHYGITPDSKVYPTTEPVPLSDDEEVEHQNVTMLGQARKKHVWKKPSKKAKADGEEGGDEAPKKKKKKAKAKKDDGAEEVQITKTKKVTKKTQGKVIETEITKKKRKKHGSDDEDDEDFEEIKVKRNVRKAKKAKSDEEAEKSDEQANTAPVSKPKKARNAKKVKTEEEEGKSEEVDAESVPISKPKKARNAKKAKTEEEKIDEADAESAPVSKSKKAPKAKPTKSGEEEVEKSEGESVPVSKPKKGRKAKSTKSGEAEKSDESPETAKVAKPTKERKTKKAKSEEGGNADAESAENTLVAKKAKKEKKEKETKAKEEKEKEKEKEEEGEGEVVIEIEQGAKKQKRKMEEKPKKVFAEGTRKSPSVQRYSKKPTKVFSFYRAFVR
eukprot:Phypoly_transcript_04002.p1 GENE.Phypoly_transcript_04002~~Phypoly_transcript_04002.p1  ORF type:complete len:672 (+),score=197.16 Phypoly_transcript_04002:138-2153(+)